MYFFKLNYTERVHSFSRFIASLSVLIKLNEVIYDKIYLESELYMQYIIL